MMLMTGIGRLAAAIPLPEARALPSRPAHHCLLRRRPMPPAGPTFSRTSSTARRRRPRSGEVDGAELAGRRVPAGRGAYTATIAETCSSTATPISSSSPRKNAGQYFSGKLRGNWRGLINHTWEARIKLDCLTPALWPSFWAVNEDPLPDGEVDIFEWYGNGSWPPGTTVHAASNGKTWEGKSIPGLVDGGWHTWRMRWDEDGFKFWRDYVDGAKPYFSVPPKPIPVHGRPATCGGRSTIPAIGCIPCSPLRSVGLAPAILPWVTSRRPCSSTGYASGSDFGAYLAALMT